MHLTIGRLIVLTIVFIVLIVITRYEEEKIIDKSYDINTKEGFEDAVIHIMNNYNKKNSSIHIWRNTRDQAIRGLLMGAVAGSVLEMCNNATSWSLIGGIVTSIGLII